MSEQAQPSLSMIARRDAAQATVARFEGCAFDWTRDHCAVLAASHAERLGHRPPPAAMKGYRTARGARRALRAAGFDSLEAALDSMGFPRIAPAAAVVGDIIGLAAEEAGDWMALTVAIGNGRVLGFQEGRCRILQPVYAAGQTAVAWRVDPCLK